MAIKIHHLNCGTLCPMAIPLVIEDGFHMACHCLLVETPTQLILVDAGFGTQDILDAKRRLKSQTLFFLRPKLDTVETAFSQIKELGFNPKDVRHIILTHLDLDHVGGISDFPEAKIHVFNDEYKAAQENHTPLFSLRGKRYRQNQWSHLPNWQRYEVNGEPWNGFSAVRSLNGLPPEILMIPLIGHSKGHCGIAIQTDNKWIFHAGDAILNQEELINPKSLLANQMKSIQHIICDDYKLAQENVKRLQDLPANIKILCSHDYEQFLKLKKGP